MADWKILQGHCLDVLRTLPGESAACVITSPPYRLGPSFIRSFRSCVGRTAKLCA